MDKETKLFRSFKEKVHENNATTSDDLIDIREETELLVEVKDIRDELKILTMVNQTQAEVISDFIDVVTELENSGTSHEKWGSGLRNLVKRYKNDIDRMDEQANATHDAVSIPR